MLAYLSSEWQSPLRLLRVQSSRLNGGESEFLSVSSLLSSLLEHSRATSLAREYFRSAPLNPTNNHVLAVRPIRARRLRLITRMKASVTQCRAEPSSHFGAIRASRWNNWKRPQLTYTRRLRKVNVVKINKKKSVKYLIKRSAFVCSLQTSPLEIPSPNAIIAAASWGESARLTPTIN